MAISDNIGQRIRTERENLQMSREALCQDGLSLTVRQLVRIEKGESLPSLDKLEFIAKRLSLTLPELVADESLIIPDEYYEMKNALIKFPTYADAERANQKLQLIDEIYNKFFPILSEEELLTLDIIENVMNFYKNEKGPKTEEIFEDAFQQVLQKQKFSINDLIVLHYYFLQIHQKKFEGLDVFENLIQKLLNQPTTTDDAHNVCLIVALMDSATIYMLRENYQAILPVINEALQLVEKTQQQIYKPGLLFLKGKYYLYYKNDAASAETCYNEAILLASVLGDEILEQGLKEEKAKDGL